MAYRAPREFAWPHALAILFLALAATGSTEYARELIRKPYVVGRHIYVNGVRQSQVERLNREGYLTSSLWVGTDGGDVTERAGLGRAMFRGQCLSCHTVEGYRSITRYLHGRDETAIANILNMLHQYQPETPYSKFMPPLVGTEAERDALARYLGALVQAPGNPSSVLE